MESDYYVFKMLPPPKKAGSQIMQGNITYCIRVLRT